MTPTRNMLGLLRLATVIGGDRALEVHEPLVAWRCCRAGLLTPFGRLTPAGDAALHRHPGKGARR